MTAAELQTDAETRVNRRARVAVALLFLTNGAVFANLLPRYPQIKAELGLSNAALGTAIAAFPLGALIAGLTAGSLIHRYRSSRVGVVGTVLTAFAILAAGLASNWWMLAAALFVGGALDAIVDVAQNAHGMRVQRRYRRSILNSFHALWSVGAVLGGLMGSAAAGADLPLTVHLSGSGALFALVAVTAYRFMLPGAETDERDVAAARGAHPGAGAEPPGRSGRSGRPERRGWRGWPAGTLVTVFALGVIACCGTITEDAGGSWGALYLSGNLGAAAATAGLAFVALQGLQFVGRLLGDRLIDRFGQRAVARFGGAITAAGMGTALAFPSVPVAVLGFGAAGLGVATLVPSALHAADELPGLPPGAGLTLVTWLLRIGFLLSPPVVGILADASSLRVGLLLVPIAGITVIALSRYLPPVPVALVPAARPAGEAP
jgi:MFS family permease